MNQEPREGGIPFGLSNNALKIIAMISMLLDHCGYYLFYDFEPMRAAGRLAFPIFAYMIAEGCTHTRNRLRYFSTIAGMALVFQIVYQIVTGSLYQSILVTFSVSIILIYALDHFREKLDLLSGVLAALTLIAAIFVSAIAPEIFFGSGFHLDYGAIGVLLPVIVYFAPDKKTKLICTLIVLIAKCIISAPIQLFSLLAVPILALYNGKRGKYRLKYMFYIFYPAHLVIIFLIKIIMEML